MGEGDRKARERRERGRSRKTKRMKREKRKGGREGRWTEPRKKKEKRQRKRKQWRREPERETATKTERNQERHRASLGDSEAREYRGGDVWWRVQVTELNPRSQGVPAGRPILKLLLAGSEEKGKRRERGEKEAGPR